ncbi:MAG: PBP1A family penicillin-binding protein [Acidobacteriota bacterium]
MRLPKRHRALIVAASAGVLLGAVSFAWIVALERRYSAVIGERLSGPRWDISSKLYGEPYALQPGMAFSQERVLAVLRNLDYRVSAGNPSVEGEYALRKNAVDVYPRAFPPLAIQKLKGPVRIVFSRGRILDINYIHDGSRMFSLVIEPQLITEYYPSSREDREVVPLSRMPKNLVNAILAAEDHRFFDHPGFDMLAMVRALFASLFSDTLQGGSTITQQLVKNYFLTPERTLKRKAQEIFMAWCLERRASKQEIMEMYVNEIYLGQRGAISINGFAKAARIYFRRNVSDMSLSECALLAGIIRAPNTYSPYKYPEKAIERRNWVLDRMAEEGYISEDLAAPAKARPLGIEPLSKEVNEAPYFADWIRRTISTSFDLKELQTRNLSIFTTIDPSMQEIAQRALRETLDRLQKTYSKRFGKRRLEGCLVAVDPRTGAIRAMVGGRDYGGSQFNRVTDAHRQPGSAFKPVVFAAAFASDSDPTWTPASLLMDEQTTFMFRGKEWTPANFEGYNGEVNLKRVLTQSLNVPTAKLALETGLDKVVQMARRMGITSKISAYPSISLGGFEVAPIEMAEVFSTIAGGGVRAGLHGIESIRDEAGEVLSRPTIERKRAMSPEVDYLLIELMKAVVDQGTAASIRSLGFGRPAAGKTGTSNDMRDCWFAGFVPQLVAIVWVGFDDNSPVGLTGAQAAVPIWTEFMSKALAGSREEDFFIPDSIAFRAIDPTTGYLATALCNQVDILPFIEGTEPVEFCPRHMF